MSGCHLAGIKSQLVKRSNTVGLNASKLLVQTTTILIKLKKQISKVNIVVSEAFTFHFSRVHGIYFIIERISIVSTTVAYR